MDSTVTYRPYKSKRHSRNISAEPAPTLSHDSGPNDHELTPSPKPRPLSISLAPVVAPVINGHSNGHENVSDNGSPPASPTASSSRLTPSPPKSKPATSTFRRVLPVSQSHAPSPLRPKAATTQSLTVSPSFRRFDSAQRPAAVPQAGPSTRTPSPAVSSPRPSAPGTPPSASPPKSSPPPPSPAVTSPIPPPPQPATSISHSSSPTPSVSTSSSTLPPRHTAAPYRPGFQPKGLYRPRTDEFLATRSAVRDRDKVEQRRLERRLEKLITLHFPPEHAPTPEKPPAAPRRSSSFFDIDFSKTPATLWRDVVEARLQRPKSDIRTEEQSITPWEDDASASQCPLCKSSFHPLTNRKHHCRLCGRIICALPRTPRCSLLFVVDPKSGRIEEVGEGVDYGVRRKGEDDRVLSGVRICRDCKVVLLRQQYLQDANRVPTYVRLYSTFTSLEKEIEDALPQFQELVLSLSSNESLTNHSHAPTTAALRTRLLASFGEYDRLAKRIRALPAPKGSAQDRVQGAIMARANLFLQKNMFPLQSLPKSTKPMETTAQFQPTDTDAALAHALQPLLEQEARLEAFVEEARAQRKFEDARTLKASLEDIRAEIERISEGGG